MFRCLIISLKILFLKIKVYVFGGLYLPFIDYDELFYVSGGLYLLVGLWDFVYVFGGLTPFWFIFRFLLFYSSTGIPLIMWTCGLMMPSCIETGTVWFDIHTIPVSTLSHPLDLIPLFSHVFLYLVLSLTWSIWNFPSLRCSSTSSMFFVYSLTFHSYYLFIFSYFKIFFHSSLYFLVI